MVGIWKLHIARGVFKNLYNSYDCALFENSYWLSAINFFHKKLRHQIFDWVLHTSVWHITGFFFLVVNY